MISDMKYILKSVVRYEYTFVMILLFHQ